MPTVLVLVVLHVSQSAVNSTSAAEREQGLAIPSLEGGVEPSLADALLEALRIRAASCLTLAWTGDCGEGRLLLELAWPRQKPDAPGDPQAVAGLERLWCAAGGDDGPEACMLALDPCPKLPMCCSKLCRWFSWPPASPRLAAENSAVLLPPLADRFSEAEHHGVSLRPPSDSMDAKRPLCIASASPC